MSAHDNGGPAFPVNTANEGGEGACYSAYGMSLRDYFAAKAMQGIMTASSEGGYLADEVAREVYAMADAMLAARKEGAA